MGRLQTLFPLRLTPGQIILAANLAPVIETRYLQDYAEELYEQKLTDYLDDKFTAEKLFALRCQKFRNEASPTREGLVFIPVGFQYQGPILAALAASVKQVYLLCSKEALTTGELIQKSLAQDFDLKIISIDPLDGKQITDTIQAIYQIQACPELVICDQTGGKKPTSSALASIAALNGWSMLYIDSQGKPPKLHSEKAIWLPNLFDSFGRLHQQIALACANNGATTAALKQLNLALEQSAISGPLLRQKKLVRQAHLFRQGKITEFCHSLNKKRWANEREIIQTAPQALLYWIIKCLLKEGQTLSAQALCQHYWQSMNIADVLKQIHQSYASSIKALQTLDKAYGRGWQLR